MSVRRREVHLVLPQASASRVAPVSEIEGGSVEQRIAENESRVRHATLFLAANIRRLKVPEPQATTLARQVANIAVMQGWGMLSEEVAAELTEQTVIDTVARLLVAEVAS